jgi:hypothetical protein
MIRRRSEQRHRLKMRAEYVGLDDDGRRWRTSSSLSVDECFRIVQEFRNDYGGCFGRMMNPEITEPAASADGPGSPIRGRLPGDARGRIARHLRCDRDRRVRHPVPATENGGEYLSGVGE